MGAEAVLMDTTWKTRMMSKTEEYNLLSQMRSPDDFICLTESYMGLISGKKGGYIEKDNSSFFVFIPDNISPPG